MTRLQRIIEQSPPVTFIADKSKHIILPGFHGIPLDDNYNKIYGSLGTILILMFLIYLNSLILLIGFELNLSITFLKNKTNGKNEEEFAGIERKL